MILDLDAGNTRLKWRLSGSGEVSCGACCYDDLQQSLARAKGARRVRVSCVAGSERLNLLQDYARAHLGLNIEIACVLEQCAGVQQGYTDRSKLGVDRWLAILAAYNEARSACLVVSCGTAITVDLVDSGGVHLGGYIVPGFELMRRSLFSGTSAVKVPPGEIIEAMHPGSSTADAVNQGCMAMVLGLIDSAAHHLGSEVVPVYLSGGDAEKLLSHLDSARVRPREQLVLDGLAYALP